ncbi:hypothetical protein GGR10_001338 [Bartonella chomelii]|uniref:Single-stranded DNA-binding protein n=1 Tax=Bartonella chomelii TaxID=236402 RepID=A0ABR6E4I8_9HYPH|nr:hypothetical protein [Bartonella chomelii]
MRILDSVQKAEPDMGVQKQTTTWESGGQEYLETTLDDNIPF